MYYPTFAEIQQLRDAAMASSPDKRKKPLLPLYRDILTDLETPVSAYCKTARGPYSFLLESVAGGERIARYSFIDRKSTRLNSSHGYISYAVFCLKKKTTDTGNKNNGKGRIHLTLDLNIQKT